MNIKERFIEMMARDEERDGIHVSDLAYECMRRGYYHHIYGNFFNFRTLMKFWKGRELHKTPFLKEHEIALEWEGVKGRCDDFEDGVLVDRKTCETTPKSANWHHINQVEYYALMLEKLGKPVSEAHILYINVAEDELEDFKIYMRKLDSIESEFLSRKKILETSLASQTPPNRNISWLCNYCEFASICFKSQEKEAKN